MLESHLKIRENIKIKLQVHWLTKEITSWFLFFNFKKCQGKALFTVWFCLFVVLNLYKYGNFIVQMYLELFYLKIVLKHSSAWH